MMYNHRSNSTKINAKINLLVDLGKVGPKKESNASALEVIFELGKATNYKAIIG